MLAVIAVSPFIVYAVAQTSRLHDAVATGGLQDVRRALKPWKALDAANRVGATPLGLALRHGKLDVARFLLEKGAAVQRAAGGVDLLAEAVRGKQAEFVSLFVEHGTALDFTAALRSAVENADLDMVRFCLRHGAPTDDALFVAVARARRSPEGLRILEALLQHGGIPRARNDEGGLLPVSALLYGQPDFDAATLELLLKSGFPLNARDNSKRTLLGIAAGLKKIDAVRMLLAHGADANDGGGECTDSGCSGPYRTALHEAVQVRGTPGKYSPETGRALVALLVGHGARVDVGDPQGNTPLMVALYDKNLAGVEALIDAGADPRLGYRGRTSLDLAQKLEDPRFRQAVAKADFRRIDEARKARAQARARTIGPRFSPTYGTVPPPAR
jgi:ankyrin repeat protein